jgi:trimeric autotransporter adhesin
VGATAHTAFLTNGIVWDIVTADDGTTYIGGDFSIISSADGSITEERANVAVFDADGNLLPMLINVQGGAVRTLTLVGTTLYLGGDFTFINAETRNYAAAVDVTSGSVYATVLPWNPDMNGTVEDIIVNGNMAYLAGAFSTSQGQSYNGLAFVDATTGVLSLANPTINAGCHLYTLALDSSTLYIGGNEACTTVNGQTRYKVAALNAPQGNLLAWNPNLINAPGIVRVIKIKDFTVYIGSNYQMTPTRNLLGAFESISGVPTSWNPSLKGLSAHDIEIKGNIVYVGGIFDQMGEEVRSNLAAVDTSGNIQNWAPDADDVVTTLESYGSLMHVGGVFSAIDGETKGGYDAIEL